MGSGVLERVLKTISRYNMLPDRARVVAAVSGGPDSVCLLHILRETGANLAGVAHFNHKLRGEASDEDERFVTSLAQRFGLPFYRAEANVSAAGGNLEQAARLARREFFAQLIRDGACDRVALGHTRDDQAETVLFRLLRGSGLSGLAGIHPVTAEGLIRPLIDVSRAEIENFLRTRGIAWREDATNRDRRFARNRIRHDLLPLLSREWNPNLAEALSRLADLAYEEETWWSGSLPELLPDILMQSGGGIEMKASALAGLPRAVARRLVRRAIAGAKGNLKRIEFGHIDRVIDLAAGVAHPALHLPELRVVRSFEWIRIAPLAADRPVEPVPVTIPGTYPAPGGTGEIRVEMDEAELQSCVNLKVKLTALELRGWRPGDHYRPVGKSHDQKIKQMFQIARVPSWRRRTWPILQSGGEVVWARTFGPAEGTGLRIFESR